MVVSAATVKRVPAAAQSPSAVEPSELTPLAEEQSVHAAAPVVDLYFPAAQAAIALPLPVYPVAVLQRPVELSVTVPSAGHVWVKPGHVSGTGESPAMHVVNARTAGVGSREVPMGHAVLVPVQAQNLPSAAAAHTSAAVVPAAVIAVTLGYQQQPP